MEANKDQRRTALTKEFEKIRIELKGKVTHDRH